MTKRTLFFITFINASLGINAAASNHESELSDLHKKFRFHTKAALANDISDTTANLHTQAAAEYKEKIYLLLSNPEE